MSNAPFQALLMVNSGADILACTQDDYWDNTVLLLHFDGVNNGTIFVDSGPKSKDLVVAGSVITRTDIFKFGQSADFGSSGGGIATNVGTDDFAFGTGDFTVELWIRTTNLAPQYVLDNLVLGDGGTWALIINATGDGTIGWWTGGGAGTLVANSTTTPADQGWVHIAVVRESGALGIYVNGTLETAVADATDYTDTVPYFLIANQRGGTGVTNFDGQMDELRITKGVARYTGASFDLATLPFCNFQGDGSGGSGDCVADEYYSCGPENDPYWDNVVLMLHGDGADGGTTFTDSSTANKTPSSSANVTTVAAGAKFGTGALKSTADGSILYAASTDFGEGPGQAFTIEFWIKIDSLVSGYFLAKSASLYFALTAGVLSTPRYSFGPALTPGVWYHIAVSETGATGYGTRDGAVIGTQVGAITNNPTMPLDIFGVPARPDLTEFVGWLDDIRITKGVARYTGNFNIPTEAFPDALELVWSPDDPRTVLSLHAEDTTDSSCYQPKMVTLLGSAVVSTDQFKFGTSSFYIPNTGVSAVHGLSIADHGDFDFGTLDWTLECWAWRDANTYPGRLFTGINSNTLYVEVGTDGLLDVVWTSSAGTSSRSNLVTFPLTQWNHVVLQRRGGTALEVYLNGVLVDTVAIAASATMASTGPLYFGRTSASSAESWNGYIDEVRITRGVARYFGEIWSDVTLDNTVMLWRNGVLADESSNASTITAVGTVALDERGFTPAASSYIRAEIGAAGSLIGDFLFELVCRDGWNNVFFMATGGGYLYNGNFESYGGSNLSLSGVNSSRVQVLAISRVGTTLRSFINGVEQASVTYAGVIDFTELQFGRYIPSNNLYFNGTYYGARLLTGVGYDANYEVEKWFDPATLPNCDSTGGSGTPTPGWAPLTGIAMSAETGGINQTNWFAALTGQQMTAGQGGLTPPGTAYNLPIGVNATYTSSRALSSSSAAVTAVEININFRYRGDVYFKIVAGTENTFGWLAPVDYSGSVISSTDCLYEVRFTRLDSSTFVEGANTFTPGTWYTGSNIESKYLDYTSSFALAASDTSASQQLSLRIQVRPTAASGLSGAAYERDYVLNFVGLVTKPASAGSTYPDLQDSSHTLNNTSTYYVDFKSDGTVRSHTGATIGRWIDADPLLPGIANQFKLQVSADPIPAGYTRVSNTLINASIKSNLSTTNRFDFTSIAPSEPLIDSYRAFTVRAVPLLSNPRYGESGYYSIHTFAIFSPSLAGGA